MAVSLVEAMEYLEHSDVRTCCYAHSHTANSANSSKLERSDDIFPARLNIRAPIQE